MKVYFCGLGGIGFLFLTLFSPLSADTKKQHRVKVSLNDFDGKQIYIVLIKYNYIKFWIVK